MNTEPQAAENIAPIREGGVSALRWAIRIFAFNLPFIITLIGVGYLPQIFHPLVIGAIIFLIPGLAWTNLRSRDGMTALFRVVLISLLAALAVWLIQLVIPGPVDRIAFILMLAAVANTGLWYGAKRGWFDLSGVRKPVSIALMVVAGLFYIQSYLGAAYFIPALEDHDSETQGTAYGIIHAGQPTMVTNRDSRFFFAHPLLLHFWIGESALLSDDLDRLRYYHDSSLAMKDETSPDVLLQQWEQDYLRFEEEPLLVPTRTPNLFLSLLVIFPLGFLVFRMTGSIVAAAGVGVLYMTLPEIYVRTAYGGYLATTNFLLVFSAYFYLNAAGLLPGTEAATAPAKASRRRGFISNFLAGWADQKGILVPLAAPVHAGLRALIEHGPVKVFTKAWMRRDVLAAIATTLGFFVGWGVFVAYGLMIAPDDFIQDHIQGHITDRLMQLDTVELRHSGESWYPSLLMLWREFSDHTGWFLVLAAIPASLYALTRVKDGHGFLLIWTVIGFVGFSLVDWRQTKHLAHILPAVVMMTAIFWASLNGRLKIAFSALLVLAIAWNATRTGMQMMDFEHIRPSPIW